MPVSWIYSSSPQIVWQRLDGPKFAGKVWDLQPQRLGYKHTGYYLVVFGGGRLEGVGSLFRILTDCTDALNEMEHKWDL